ncbi:hypothetical protein [Nakamurella sp.]|uniref:hypothetical protein n=1 Tax=Nakamurella sp. TaxID=1869182 RepID=UPI003B39FCF6
MRIAARCVLVTLIVVLGLGTAVTAPAAAAPSSPAVSASAVSSSAAPAQTRLWLNVTAVDPTTGAEITAPIVPGARFQYRFAVYCSQVGPGCLDAKTAFVLPAGITVSGPAGTANRLVGYDSATRTVTVYHQERWSYTSSTTGIPSGATRRFAVDARVEDATAPGRIVLTGTSSARNAPASNESAAVTVVAPTGTVSAVGSSSLSATTLIALTKARTTATLGVRNASTGGAQVASLTAAVSMPTWDLFYLYEIKPITSMPAGADQVSLQYCGITNCTDDQYIKLSPVPGSALALPAGVNRRGVGGLKFVFSNSTGAPLPASTVFSSQAVVFEMRDDYRGSGEVLRPLRPTTAQICTVPEARSAAAGTVRGTDACSTFTYQPSPTSLTTSASFVPDANGSYAANGKAVEGASSPVSFVAAAQNTTAFPVTSLGLIRRSLQDYLVDISAVRFTFPAGATRAEVVLSCGDTQKASTIPSSSGPVVTITSTDFCATGKKLSAVSVVFRGSIPTGAVGGLAYHGTLTSAAHPPSVTDTVDSFVDAGASGSTGQPAYGTLTVHAPADPTGPVTADIAYTGGVDANGRIVRGQPVTYQFTVTNSGSSPATDLTVGNPGGGVTGVGSVFNAVTLTGVTLTTTPASLADHLTPEIFDAPNNTWLPVDGATASQVAAAQGVQFRKIDSDSVPAGAVVTVAVTTTVRSDAPIGGTVVNCLSGWLVNAAGPVPTGDVCAPPVTVGS